MKLEIEKASNGYIITLPAENEEHIEQKIVTSDNQKSLFLDLRTYSHVP